MGQVQVRIKYRGRGSREQFGIGPPKPEIITTAKTWGVGDELRPGWFVHEITVDGGMVTYIVELSRTRCPSVTRHALEAPALTSLTDETPP